MFENKQEMYPRFCIENGPIILYSIIISPSATYVKPSKMLQKWIKFRAKLYLKGNGTEMYP